MAKGKCNCICHCRLLCHALYNFHRVVSTLFGSVAATCWKSEVATSLPSGMNVDMHMEMNAFHLLALKGNALKIPGKSAKTLWHY